jgi:hypothetical protein
MQNMEREDSELKVLLPHKFNPEWIKLLRESELTSCEDNDEFHKRVGWLICAYDLIVEKTTGRSYD